MCNFNSSAYQDGKETTVLMQSGGSFPAAFVGPLEGNSEFGYLSQTCDQNIPGDEFMRCLKSSYEQP